MDYTFGGDYQDSNSSLVQTANRSELSAADVADVGLDRLRNGLLLSYLMLLIIVPAISYMLARRSLKPIQKGFEEQQRFVDDASHELRTPLSVIQGELELALSKKRSLSAYQAAISTSLDEVHHLIDLTTQLLLMARGSQLAVKNSTEIIQVADVVTTCVAKYKKIYSEKHLNIEMTLSNCAIDGIPELITQAISNVLDNAAKFNINGGRILIHVSSTNNKVILTVKDNGKGMSKVYAQKAFKRFWRGDNSRTVKGFGLGLPLVRQIIELHHGGVTLSSTPGKGTTVIITLPAIVL